jgi:uncharacterized membrane protein
VLAVALACGLLAAASGTASASGGKSLTLVSLDTAATITPSGDLLVVEQVTYRFSGGPFTVGVRSFESDRTRVVGMTVSEAGRPLVVDPPSSTPTGEWEWRFDRPATNEERSFELRYTVEGAVQVGPDVGELYWKFVGSDHPGIGSMSVRVAVPGSWPPAVNPSGDDPGTPDDDAGVLRAWAHGPANGTLTLLPNAVEATVTGVPARQFVELRILVPSAAFTVAPSGEPRLARVLAEERSFLQREDDRQRRRDLAGVLAPIAAIVGLLSTGLLWFGFGREPRPSEQIGIYWREPLTDPPAVTMRNLRRGGLAVGPAIGATLIDMAQQGFLTITAERVERFGPDRTVHTFHRCAWSDAQHLTDYERHVLRMVLRGQESMSSDDLHTWGRANASQAATEIELFKAGVDAEFKARGYGTELRPLSAVLLLAAAAVAGLVGFLALRWEQLLGWLAIGVVPVMLVVGFPLLWNRNVHSATEAKRARSTKKFLTDFSNLEEAPVGHLILWERHLVDAVTLGVAKDLVKGLAARLPEVANNPAFASWYVGTALGARRLDDVGSFGVVGSQIASSFAPPSNSSGGGGGFSGGGGGGGGGGGFGAR